MKTDITDLPSYAVNLPKAEHYDIHYGAPQLPQLLPNGANAMRSKLRQMRRSTIPYHKQKL